MATEIVEVVGMDHDKQMLIQRLLAVDATEDADEVFEIIPIVGIAGSGKTTLARLVFDDPRIIQHFNPRLWMSDTGFNSYEAEEQQIAQFAPKANSYETEEQQIAQFVPKANSKENISPLILLNERRYLLVFDDVLDSFGFRQDVLWRRGYRGSKILVITYSKNVASSVSKAPAYYVTGLNEDDSMKLLMKYAFPQGQEHDYPNLLKIRMNIVKKCCGNPSIILALGSLLADRLHEDYWEHVKVTDLWRLNQERFNILASLSESYYRLWLHTRSCFAYCALFPRGHKFEMKTMIQLWSAEGFLYHDYENGVQYVHIIDELLSSSFIYKEERDADGRIKTFEIPDIFYDLAQSVAIINFYEQNTRSEKETEEGYTYISKVLCGENSMRVSFKCCSTASTKFWTTNAKESHLQTLLRHGLYSDCQPKNSLNRFRDLVVLDLHGCGILHVSNYIGELEKLTYLDLSNNPGITELPETICQLYLLQTLKLLGCNNLAHLPVGIQEMSNLICLETSSKTNTPAWIGSSRYLLWLPNFVLGQEASNPKLSKLGSLNMLKDELHIFNLEYAAPKEAELASLKGKKFQELELAWRIKVAPQLILGNNTAKEVDYSVLEALQPNECLEKLSIKGYASIQFPNWMMTFVSSISCLVELSLIKCVNCVTLPPLFELTSLKILTLKNLTSLEYVQQEISHSSSHKSLFFPSLQSLFFSHLPRLVGWLADDPYFLKRPQQNGHILNPFPCLEKLTIKHCPGLYKMHIDHVLQQVKFKASRATLLESLILTSCNENVYLNPSSPSSLSPSYHQQSTLVSLEINLCRDLESLPDCRLVNLSTLRSLSIINCQMLKSLSDWLQQLPILEILKIQWCPNVKLFEHENGNVSLRKLHSLTLSGIPGLENLSTGFRNAKILKNLCVEYCKSLKCLSLEAFPSIEHLEISCCQALSNLSTGREGLILSSLKMLKVKNCLNLDFSTVNVNDLHKLEWLIISGAMKMPSITHALQQASALKLICIEDCQDLEAFSRWLSILKSLTEIIISDCPNLTNLPEEIEILTNLQKLSIEKCPNLFKNGLKKHGKDWKKIQHVKTLSLREATYSY